MPTWLVVGAGGATGLAVVSAAGSRGDRVRGLVRRAGVLPPGFRRWWETRGSRPCVGAPSPAAPTA
jgi:hypothetical protein